MYTLIKQLIKSLNIFVAFLEIVLQGNKLEDTSSLHSLAPKVLTDDNDIESIRPYLNNLKQAVDTAEINNIAITGSYGSGKSTILKTFQHIYPNHLGYEYLNISLASFKDNKSTPEDLEFERRLEVSILQQMFYHVEPSIIPDSRFKRIVNLTPQKLFLYAFLLIIWTFSALILFKFNYVDKLNPEGWKSIYSIDWVALISSTIFFAGIGLFFKRIYRLFKNSKINKLNIRGELELGDTIDKSIFNQHLEEILYFFERTKFNVVIIEDVDRFDSTDIFTKLREINILINHSNLIKRSVKFIYAIKDEMFKDKIERVKFFDFIIPVIPFINPSNASDQLTKLINSAKLQNVLSPEFTSDVVAFIDDIDMRLLINIFHEYKIYRSLLSKELKQDNLFAIIVYKNLYPADFGELQRRQGKLYEFFNNKPKYIEGFIKEQLIKIDEIDKRIELLKNEPENQIRELRAVYIYRLVSKLKNFISFDFGKKVDLNAVLEDEYFDIIKESNGFKYFKFEEGYSSQLVKTSTVSSVKFKEIEKEVSNKLSYNQREQVLIDKAENQVNILKIEKDRIKNEINALEVISIKDLFQQFDVEDCLGSFSENNLMRNLLLNGYIDEYYDDYITLFHEVNLTKEDFIFEKKVKSGINLPFDYKLSKLENLVRRIPDHYFKKEAILNYNLLAFLLKNKTNHEIRINHFFQGLSFDGELQFKFIHGFIKNKPENIQSFIKKLCSFKPTLWEYMNDKSGLPEAEIERILKYIFDSADLKSIQNFRSIQTLEDYLAKMGHFFSFCASLMNSTTIQMVLKNRNILIETLDLPTNSQNKIFEFVYYNNLYQINHNNILTIIKAKNENIDRKKLNVAPFSTLLNSSLKDLLGYIDENIEKFINQVVLSLDTIEEDESTIISILNRDDIIIDVKEEVINILKNKIVVLNGIQDIEVKKVVLKKNKVVANWVNVLNYFDSVGETEFDDNLISFLNEKKNHAILTKLRLDKSGLEEDYLKQISTILIQCEAIEIDAYGFILKSIPYVFDDLDFDDLATEKIELLISKSKLRLTSENFDSLREKGDNLHIKLIENHQHDFISRISELVLDNTDWLHILQSNIIKTSLKLKIIQSLDEGIIINNPAIANEVCEIQSNGYNLPFSYQVLKSLLNSHAVLSKRVNLLNNNFNELNDNEIEDLTKILGGDYEKIFMKQHKPTFSYNDHHMKLFEKLQQRNLIIRYEVNTRKDIIKVFAKY